MEAYTGKVTPIDHALYRMRKEKLGKRIIIGATSRNTRNVLQSIVDYIADYIARNMETR
jgi:hypothetical protein